MKCPECSAKTKCLETRAKTLGTYRRYQCPECKTKLTTMEKVVKWSLPTLTFVTGLGAQFPSKKPNGHVPLTGLGSPQNCELNFGKTTPSPSPSHIPAFESSNGSMKGMGGNEQ